MKPYTLDEVQDELIRKIGTAERDRFGKNLFALLKYCKWEINISKER
jgi:hypothetical protein